jgi:hypothetical protein
MQSFAFWYLIAVNLKTTRMIRLLFLCLCLLYTLPSCVEKAKANAHFTSAIPVLKTADNTALKISKLAVEVNVTGNIATTTFDISFYNPQKKVLEGEFDFPLADGQNVVRYALDMDGKLREGVVVEKAKARSAFENTVRRKIDPGLVEKTKGNNFRTRIYPIPAQGYKRIVIAMEQPLASSKNGIVYKLPLFAEEALEQFSLQTVVYQSGKPILKNNTLKGFSFNEQSNNWKASYTAANYKVASEVSFTIPEAVDEAFTETKDSKTYFYQHLPIEPAYRDKPAPKSIALLWDISGSAQKRNLSRETALLNDYFSRLNNITVHLVPFHINTLPQEQFVIQNGDAGALIRRLLSFSFDGGTQLGAIDLHPFTDDEVLMVSDGMSTFGKATISLSDKPVTLINSSPAPDYSYLKNIAKQTGGKLIDLNTLEPEAALNELTKESLHFIRAVYNPNDVLDLTTPVTNNLQNGFAISGELKKDAATVKLEFGFGNTVTQVKSITIKKGSRPAPNIGRIWASTTIDNLDLESEPNKQSITDLGKQFSIVTRYTSLLVLDRVEDYVQYEITPPADLQAEYFALLKEKQRADKSITQTAYDDAVAAMNDMKSWYDQTAFHSGNEGAADSSIALNGNGERSTSNFTAPQMVADSEVEYEVVANQAGNAPAQPSSGLLNMEVAGDFKSDVDADGVEDELNAVSGIETKITTAKIDVKEWTPDAPYLTELAQTPATQYTQKYLALKEEYASQPSFFVDAARFFFEKGNKPMALLVLSNLAEMKLESPELLRIVANQLLEFGEPALAVEVLKEVANMREEEPQSYRDLALAYNEIGAYQQAVDLLYKVALGNWDARFGGVKIIALTEMNGIISAHPANVSTAAIDKQFIQNMPMDVRIVIGWSSNDSDVDLWVTDPAKEKCYYQNTTTRAGGMITKDVTQGYGPESFCIKKATTGNYNVAVNLYGDSRQTIGGPITIKAEMFTNFGRPDQQRKTINLRVTTNKEVVTIGDLQFNQQTVAKAK